MIDLVFRMYSWVMGRLVVLIPLAVLALGVWWAVDSYGDRRAASAKNAVYALWAAQTLRDTEVARKAQAAADAALARQKEATIAAVTRYQNEQVETVRLAGVNAALSLRLRSALAAARRDPVPAAPADPGEPVTETFRLDAGTVFDAVDGFARACSKSRDDLASQVNALIDAWPR